MALEGIMLTDSYGSGRYYYVRWTAEQSIANNTSSVNWTVGCAGGSNWYAERTLKVVIAGQTVFEKSARVERYAGDIASGTITINHNEEGNASFTVRLDTAVYVTSVNIIGIQTFTLDQIPRRSTLSVGNGTLGTAQTLTVTRKSSAFKHSIAYTCGSLSGTVVSNSTSTSIPFTPPVELAAAAPNGTSVIIQYTIETFNGSESIGKNVCNATYSIPASVKPTVSLSVTDGNGHLARYGAYVQGKSNLSVKVTASGAYGSKIASYSSTANGATYTSASFTTDLISGTGTLTIKATVKDSRGRTATAEAKVSVVPYTAPRIKALKASRCDSDGTLNTNGQYLVLTFSADVTSLDGKNTAIYKVWYRKESVEESTQTILTDYANIYSVTDGKFIFPADQASSYVVTLGVLDSFEINGVRKTTNGGAVSKLFSFLAKGTGIAFGKIAEIVNGFEVYFEKIKLTGTEDVTIKGKKINLNDTEGILRNGVDLLKPCYTNDVIRMANTILAAPDGKEGFAAFRKLTAADLPYPDYITAHGPSGQWMFIKWNSGLAICLHSAVTGGNWYGEAWGGVYDQESAHVSFSDYPFTFADVPFAFAARTTADDASMNSLWSWIAMNGGSNKTPPKFMMVRGSQATIGHPYLRMIAIGRWK